MNGPAPILSIIIPTYNDWERLSRCIETLNIPADGSAELIIVDNGSDDQPAEWYDPLQATPFIYILNEPTPGSYIARNTGLKQARGQIIAFTDSDCLPADDWIRNGIRAIQDADQPIVVAGPIDYFARDAARPNLVERYDLVKGWPVQEYVEKWHFGVTANIFADRAVIDAVGGFDPDLKSGGDSEWCKRAHAAGFPVLFDETVRVHHPARTTVRSIWKKARRVGGGLHDIHVRTHSATSYLTGSFVRDMLPPIKPSLAMWRKSEFSLPEKLGAIWIEWVYNYGRTFERLRLTFGGDSRRS